MSLRTRIEFIFGIEGLYHYVILHSIYLVSWKVILFEIFNFRHSLLY